MSEISWTGTRSPARPAAGDKTSANLADLLERILDKGIVIVGDIRINLLDIELLTIKLRLLVASVDRAKEMGIDWWEHDPTLSSKARQAETETQTETGDGHGDGHGDRALREENRRLRERLAALEAGDAATSHSSHSSGTASTQDNASASETSDAVDTAGTADGPAQTRKEPRS